MIRLVRFIVFIAITINIPIALASYSMTELEASALEVPDTINTVVWENTDTNYPDDDDKQTVSIGFPFQFDDTIYNSVTIFTNGILKFGAIERMHRDYRNEALATDEGDRFIAIYWDDLVDDASSSVTYGSLGTSPNRKFVVNWTNVRAYSNNLRYDFQAVLYENGDIRYRYNNNTSNGQSATIGLEINDLDFIQYSYNANSVETSFDLLFRNQLLALPAPHLQYRLDEVEWDGSAGEVKDSTLNNLHGRAFNGAMTSDASPALGSNIGTCNYGDFDGNNDYVEIADNNLLDFLTNFSVGAWVKIDALPASGLKTIISKDENYEFHVNASGQIFWWWQSAANQTRQLTSNASISAGSWNHIVISYATGQQTIFINGSASGSASHTENAKVNSDPLQIASDQNFSGRYFNGDIDEVNIFDQALSEMQAYELMNKTRPCSSINLCISSFPDGLNSHNNGTISFGRDAQLFFSPDDILDANNIVINGFSNDKTCVSVECQANGLASDITTPPTFPDTSGFSENISIGNNSSGSSNPAINQYDQIDIGNGSVFTFSGSFSDYYIDTLGVGNNTELELLPGNYWIRNLDTGSSNNPNSGLEIRVIGSGTARLYINDNVLIGQTLLANSPSQGSAGDPSKLMLYGYNNLTLERNATFSGIIYAAGDVDVQRDGNVYGAIAASDITLGRLTNVFYNPSAAANLDYGELCESASCTLGSFNIIQPEYALACPDTRAQVSIQAMCDDGTSLKDDYIGTVDLSSSENSLTEFYASTTANTVINSIDFDGSEAGLKSVYLFHQNEQPNLQVIAADAAVGVSTTSNNATDFRTSGFAASNPSSFVCGNSSSFSLTAIGQDDTGASCQVLTGFNGSKALKAWYQVNLDADIEAEPVSTSLSMANQLINDQTEPAANNINLTFNNGVATIPLGYANAGQILAVNVKHDDAPYDNSVPELAGITLNASTASFVVSPEAINLSIASASSACASADASCSKFVAAGSDFVVNAQAQCVGGGIADDYQGDISLSHSLVAPAAVNLGTLAVTAATISAVDGGSIQINNQAISEVGVFNLMAEDSDYFSESITPFTLANVGRFYPAYFAMTSNSVGNSCGSFSYMDQPGMAIAYTLQAHKTGGGLLLNYHADFAKATLALVAENNNDGGSYQLRLVGFNGTNWVNGEYLYADTGMFSRASVVDGPYPQLEIAIKLSDNDGGVSDLNALDLKADTNTDCTALGNCDAKWLGSTVDVRFGQLKLGNVFGPESFDLDMRVQSEYFDGADFIINSDDNCTNLLVSDPPLTPDAASWSGRLDPGETLPSLITDISAGRAVLRFSAPGIGNEGSVLFEYNADTWLKTENTGDGSYDDNAAGKITFGQYRGNDRMLYWRELVR